MIFGSLPELLELIVGSSPLGDLVRRFMRTGFQVLEFAARQKHELQDTLIDYFSL